MFSGTVTKLVGQQIDAKLFQKEFGDQVVSARFTGHPTLADHRQVGISTIGAWTYVWTLLCYDDVSWTPYRGTNTPTVVYESHLEEGRKVVCAALGQHYND